MGIAGIFLSASLFLLLTNSTEGLGFTRAATVVLGLSLVAQGAAGLLRESREGLSLWLSVLNTLLLILVLLLWEAYLYVLGPLAAGLLATFLVLIKFGEWVQYRSQR